MTLLRTVSNYLTKIQLWVREQHCSQWVQKWSCCSPADIERDVMKGKIAAYHSGSGQVLSEGNAYHFHINMEKFEKKYRISLWKESFNCLLEYNIET